MVNRLLIIQPSYYRSKSDRTVFKVRRRNVVPLTLPYLAALTPKDWKIELLDEQLQSIDFARRLDLVAISAWTLSSYRAYDIADEFRRRGVPVILGGPHTAVHPSEAAEHCDSVAFGEAEYIWPQMLEDLGRGRLRKIYQAGPASGLQGLPLPRYDLLDLRHYGPFKTFVVVASRGCPFHCEFCSERLLLGDGYRCRPAPEVIAEIQHCRGRNILFGDSNFGGSKDHAMQIMEAMIPLKVRWSALWSAHLCHDAPFLDLAQRSGLLHVNIGVESLSPETLAGMNKRSNQTPLYAEMLLNLRRRGISYSLNFIFGWDGENDTAFASTLQFLHQHKVPVAHFNILTPVKGTPLYDRLFQQGRILNGQEIDRWPGQACHFQPLHGTPAELERRVQSLYRDFYSLSSILSRLPMPWTKSNLASWFINLTQRRVAQTQNVQNSFDGY